MVNIRQDLLANTSAKVKRKADTPTLGYVRNNNNNFNERMAKTAQTVANGGVTSAGQNSGYVPGSGISNQQQATVQQSAQQLPRPYYTDANGNRTDAYIKDGVTYTDPNYTQRVPVGSTVYTTDGRSYRMTPSGGVPSEQTILNDYASRANSYIDEYRASRDAYNQKIDNDVQMALDRIYAQQAGIDREREAANRAAYGAYQQASSPYGASAQQLAAIGLNHSGLSESGRIAAGSAYQNAISDNELARITAIQELNRQANEAMLTGQGQKAEAYAEYARNLASMGMQSEQYMGNLSLNAADLAYGKERDSVYDARYADETQYNRNQEARDNILELLSLGIISEDAAQKLGVPQSEIDIVKADRDRDRRIADKTADYDIWQIDQLYKEAARAEAARQADKVSYAVNRTATSKKSESDNNDDNGGYNPEKEPKKEDITGDAEMDRIVKQTVKSEMITDPKEISELYRYAIDQALANGRISIDRAKELYTFYGVSF